MVGQGILHPVRVSPKERQKLYLIFSGPLCEPRCPLPFAFYVGLSP
jgi:hypothetical protein